MTAVLRVGLLPFNIADLQACWRECRDRHPQWELQIRRAPFIDPFGSLRKGELDVLVTWLPVEETDLTAGGPVVLTGPRLLAVPVDDALAARSSVALEILADRPHATAPSMPDCWEDRYLPFHTPRGRRIERVRSITNIDDVINLVGTGETVQCFPAHVTGHWAMSHIRWPPIRDMPPLTYALVWRTESDSDPVRALAGVVEDLGPMHFDHR